MEPWPLTDKRGRRSKYPFELRERAVRMVLEVRKDTGQSFGVITRVPKELRIGSESLRKWVTQAEIDRMSARGPQRSTPEGWLRWSVTTGSPGS